VLTGEEAVGEDEVGLRRAPHDERVGLAQVLERLADRGRDEEAEWDRDHRAAVRNPGS